MPGAVECNGAIADPIGCHQVAHRCAGVGGEQQGGRIVTRFAPLGARLGLDGLGRLEGGGTQGVVGGDPGLPGVGVLCGQVLEPRPRLVIEQPLAGDLDGRCGGDARPDA